MSTPFAVATAKQAKDLKALQARNVVIEDASLLRARGFIDWGKELTDAGRLALELREALGPDRGLTKAGAKALMWGAPTRATKVRLMEDGLVRRDAFFQLTEDGERVRAILVKYKADV